MEFSLKKAAVGRHTLQYLDEGKGTPIILIHGLAGDYSGWLAQINVLRHCYRVIAFDNRGAGKSTQIDEPVSTADLADDTLQLMNYLCIKRAHIVGRSMGGAVAQHMALKAPQRIISLVLCASFARLDPLGRRVLLNMREALEWRMNWRDHARHSTQNFVSADFFNSNRTRVDAIEKLIGSETRLPACYIRQNEACQMHDTVNDLGRITQPTLIMAGDSDPICSLTATNMLSAGLANARTEIFSNAGHFFLMEHPEKFMSLLSGWLQENDPNNASRRR